MNCSWSPCGHCQFVTWPIGHTSKNYGRSQEVETSLKHLKYVNWLVQKQSTCMYHQNQTMHSSSIHIKHTKSWRHDSVGVSLAIYSHKSVAGDLIILGGTQLQGIKMCSVLHRSWIPQKSYWTSRLVQTNSILFLWYIPCCWNLASCSL